MIEKYKTNRAATFVVKLAKSINDHSPKTLPRSLSTIRPSLTVRVNSCVCPARPEGLRGARPLRWPCESRAVLAAVVRAAGSGRLRFAPRSVDFAGVESDRVSFFKNREPFSRGLPFRTCGSTI